MCWDESSGVCCLGDKYKDFLEVIKESMGEMEQVKRLRGLVFHLPVAHYHTLKFLLRHLNRIAQHSDKNKVHVVRPEVIVFSLSLSLSLSLPVDGVT